MLVRQGVVRFREAVEHTREAELEGEASLSQETADRNVTAA
jgi:hypothetical protein